MSDNDFDLGLDDIAAGDISLESILAEYKGSAFINGDKKTPPELLNEQTERILKEVVGSAKSGLLFSTKDTEYDPAPEPPAEPGPEAAGFFAEAQNDEGKQGVEQAPRMEGKPARMNRPDPRFEMRPEQVQATAPAQERAKPEGGAPAASEARRDAPDMDKDIPDNTVAYFDNYSISEQETQDSIVQHVEEAIEREYGEPTRGVQAEVATQGVQEDFVGAGLSEDEPSNADYEWLPEPELKDEAKRFAAICNSISLRCIPMAIITLMMVIMTFAFEAGLRLPFGIGRNLVAANGVLIIFMLVVMMLCAEIIIKGVFDLSRGVPNIETLLLFSCVFSLISGVITALRGSPDVLAYCAVSSLSLTFAAFGERFNLGAITDTLKTATASSTPYGVQAEYNKEIDKSVLKKVNDRTDGFYTNLIQPDIAETAYRFATPALLIAALVLSVFTVIIKGGGANFFHILSALLAAAAPFSALIAFSVPFSMIAKSIRKSGAALAGWGGADDVCFTDGASVTDEDLFPPGTLSLGGMKLFDGASPEKAIRYTSSLIIASGSGLARVFSDVLKAQDMSLIKVDDFICYEAGVSALIRGERVMTGSAAFMDLLGIRIPDELSLSNAVFTAVNNKLTAMFAVEYTPANSVQSALISILKWRIKLFFAVRDFNVTPSMLEHKFRVSLEDFEYPQARDSYSISDSFSAKDGRMAAVLTREGFGPFAEAVTGGMLLKTAALFATGVSVFSAALGVIIMFYMCWTGSFVSARPGNLILFMLAMFAIALIVCYYVKIKK